MLDGIEVLLNGVNYYPAYFPALMPDSWFAAKKYRPAVIEEDLSTLASLGVNLVAVQGPRITDKVNSEDCRNLREFLSRAQAHGMLVHLYIGGGSLMPFPDPAKLAIIPRDCALAGNPALFAYDIAWEPLFGLEQRRRTLQPAWEKWLQVRYGSLAAAAAAFGGDHAPPSDQAFCAAAPSVKVAAFRRFLDDLLSATYRDARAAIHAVDTTHLIGARSGYGGNGVQAYCAEAPVDLRAGAKHLDFISPEAYALPKADRIGLLTRGGFTGAYADVGKPVFWAEFGVNVDGSCATCTESVQAYFFAGMFDLMRRTSANGGAAWWYVGVRPQSPADTEHSDYGIIRDGAGSKGTTASLIRPAALLLKGALSGVSAEQRKYAAWITVDRDATAGDWKMYEQGTKAYGASASGGQPVGVRTACTGTTSKEVLQCVGNTPYNGSCPAKCLNAEWELVQIKDVSGNWKTVADEESVTVAAGKPVHARLTAGNTGEARWLTSASAGGATGAVRFGCNENAGGIGCRREIASNVRTLRDAESGEFVVSPGVTASARLVFQMLSENVGWFGASTTVTLVPR
jgi:hypothetical protein